MGHGSRIRPRLMFLGLKKINRIYFEVVKAF